MTGCLCNISVFNYTISPQAIPAMHHIICSYPNYITVDDLPLEDAETKVSKCYFCAKEIISNLCFQIEFATVLYSKGIIITKN